MGGLMRGKGRMVLFVVMGEWDLNDLDVIEIYSYSYSYWCGYVDVDVVIDIDLVYIFLLMMPIISFTYIHRCHFP